MKGLGDLSAMIEADQDVAGLISLPESCYTEPMNFSEFMKTYKRTYELGTPEYSFRKGLFELHTVAARMQNCKLNSTWVAGVNAHADWTEEELASLRGYKRSARSRRQPQSSGPSGASRLLGSRARTAARIVSHELDNLPESASWGHLAAIRKPRDQGQCGSCWAHTAETVVRAHSEIYGNQQNFSVDELISCVPNPQECGGQGGCRGATIELAYDYIIRNGLSLEPPESEDSLGQPWDQVYCPPGVQETFAMPVQEVFLADGRQVHFLQEDDMPKTRPSMIGWSKLPENREEPMVRALVEMGPLAVAVAAGWQWNLYKSGIMSVEDSCQDQVITHAIVLFGYGSEDGTRYWHLKNSWGDWWGEAGNIRLQRLDQEEHLCDWDTKPEVGTGCLGGPPQVWVCGACGILYDTSLPHFRLADLPRDVPPQEDDIF